MINEFTLTLNSPITEEQWDAITDVDFEYTNEITFHTKHGKEVVFVKKSAQPDQRWIPVSERLPEKGKDVLVTRHYLREEDNNKSCYYTEVAARYGDDDNPDWISFSDEYKMHPKNHIVIAWQELPEPYKEGKQND